MLSRPSLLSRSSLHSLAEGHCCCCCCFVMCCESSEVAESEAEAEFADLFQASKNAARGLALSYLAFHQSGSPYKHIMLVCTGSNLWSLSL